MKQKNSCVGTVKRQVAWLTAVVAVVMVKATDVDVRALPVVVQPAYRDALSARQLLGVTKRVARKPRGALPDKPRLRPCAEQRSTCISSRVTERMVIYKF